MKRKSTVSQCVLFFYIIHLFAHVTTVLCANDTLEIDLPQGKIRGSFSWLEGQRKFLGIPYASVTNRFEEPGSPPSWNGTFNAYRGNIKCNQYFSTLKTPIGQEDCLVLNIFAPPSVDKPLPVMVFIHGGGFYAGSNSNLIYNPKYFVKENVIFVTINYRLGAFGFLCLGLNEAPGNVGLQDQIAALKWIHSNIAYFGGDPDSVTLIGESVGGFSVNHLILSNVTDGLFHRAIIQSGSIMMPQAFIYHPIESASKVASNLGYNTSDPHELLKIFKNSTADDIVGASYFDQTNNVFAPYLFRPCIETATTNRTPLITTGPTELVKESGLNISVIFGYNNREGIYYAANYDMLQTLEKIKNNFDRIIPNYLQFENDSDKTSFSETIFQMYFENRTAIDGLVEYFSDSLITYPTTVMSEAFLKTPDRSVYNYYFKYDSARNLNKFRTRLRFTPGACHGDELFYMFDPAIYAVLPTSSKDMRIIKTMTKLWTTFAKTGEPSGANTNWVPSGEQLNFLEIDTNTTMITLPNKERIDFWRNTFEKYGRREK